MLCGMGSVIPGSRQVVFTVKGVLDGCLDICVVIADYFTVWPKVMFKPFHTEPRTFRFRAKLGAQQPDEPGALRKGTIPITGLAELGAVFFDRRRSERHVLVYRPLLRQCGWKSAHPEPVCEHCEDINSAFPLHLVVGILVEFLQRFTQHLPRGIA